MNVNDLIPDNVGRDVLIESLNGFNDARATFRAWSKDMKTIIVSLNSTYGRAPKMVKCEHRGIRLPHDPDCPTCHGTGQRNSGRGKLLTEGTVLEIPIGNVRFAPEKKQ